MPKLSAMLSGILACMLGSGVMTVAMAGDVILVSDTWDDVCRVEVTWGPDAPKGTPVETHFNVPKNWSITRPDRLCYRRASTPDNCDSGMTQWNTQWRCAAGTTSGVAELSLQ